MSMEIFKLGFTAIGLAVAVGLAYVTGMHISQVFAAIAFIIAMRTWGEGIFFYIWARQNESVLKEMFNTNKGSDDNDRTGSET